MPHRYPQRNCPPQRPCVYVGLPAKHAPHRALAPQHLAISRLNTSSEQNTWRRRFRLSARDPCVPPASPHTDGRVVPLPNRWRPCHLPMRHATFSNVSRVNMYRIVDGNDGMPTTVTQPSDPVIDVGTGASLEAAPPGPLGRPRFQPPPARQARLATGGFSRGMPASLRVCSLASRSERSHESGPPWCPEKVDLSPLSLQTACIPPHLGLSFAKRN